MDLTQALLKEADWLRQQLEIKDQQLALAWRENHLLRQRCESLELSRRTYDVSTHRLPGLAPSGQRGIDGEVGQDSPPGGTEVVCIQPGEVPPCRVLPVGPTPAGSPVPRGGDASVAWDPWFQYADALLVLSRIEGSREEGTAKLTTYPTARMDTFNTKCSLPGLAPEFVFKDWDVFWSMIENRNVPTDEDFAKVEIPAAQAPEEETPGPDTIDDAKKAIMHLAIKHGALKSNQDKQGAAALVMAGAEADLDMDNALAHYPQWVELIKTKWPLNGEGDG